MEMTVQQKKTKILKIINTLLQCKEKYCNSLQAHRVV